MSDGRITWMRGARRDGPCELIGVLEVRGDGGCRAVFAERTEVDGRCHILLARSAWGPKDSLETRWYSLVLDGDHKAYSVRTGSCGDALTSTDVPNVARALGELQLVTEHTIIHVDGNRGIFPGRVARSSEPAAAR